MNLSKASTSVDIPGEVSMTKTNVYTCKQFTCKHSIILYSYHKKFLNNILGQRVVLSVRISDPATVLGLHLIEIANFKKPLRKLNRSRIPGIYLTLIDKFPDVSTFFLLVFA